MRTLTRLNVSQNQGITAAGLRYIGSMTRLRELNLSSCSITPASLDSLAGACFPQGRGYVLVLTCVCLPEGIEEVLVLRSCWGGRGSAISDEILIFNLT